MRLTSGEQAGSGGSVKKRRVGQVRGLAASAAVGAAFLAPAGLVLHASGQQETERRIENRQRQAEPLAVEVPRTGDDRTTLTFSERALIDVGGFFNYSFLNLQDADANGRRLNQYDTTLYGRAVFDDTHTLFGRARFRYRDFSPGDSFDGRGDEWVEPYLDRYWYELTLRGDRRTREDGSEDLSLDFDARVGRQFVDWGAGLALSENLYAARPTLTIGRRVSIEGLVGITPGDESVIDFDASRDEYNRRTERGYFGGLVRYTFESGHDAYFFGLRMQDYNTTHKARFGTAAGVDFRYDANYFGVGSTGSIGPDWLYLAEFVYEDGDSMSDPLLGEQRREDIEAFAARGQLTYLFRDANQTRAQLEMLFASGDQDRRIASDTVGGNRPGTSDHGFNSLGFANTGLAFAPSLSNLWSSRLGINSFPFSDTPVLQRLQVGIDGLIFTKLAEAGGIDEATRDETFLGGEIDLFANYRVTSDTAVSLRYGAFFPGSAIAGQRDTRNFVLLGVTVSF